MKTRKSVFEEWQRNRPKRQVFPKNYDDMSYAKQKRAWEETIFPTLLQAEREEDEFKRNWKENFRRSYECAKGKTATVRGLCIFAMFVLLLYPPFSVFFKDIPPGEPPFGFADVRYGFAMIFVCFWNEVFYAIGNNRVVDENYPDCPQDGWKVMTWSWIVLAIILAVFFWTTRNV